MPAELPVAFRRSTAEDFAFFFRVHETTRRGSLEAAGAWDTEAERAHLRTLFRPGEDLVVQEAGRDIGVLALGLKDGLLWLRRIQLLPEAQNRGIGSAILKALLAEARGNGTGMVLRVRKDNPARRLYERFGFRVAGEMPGERLEMIADATSGEALAGS